MSEFETNTVNIEDVFNTAMDQEEAAAVAEASLLPEGNYITLTPMLLGEAKVREVETYGERVNGTYQQLDTPVTINRVVVQVYGQVIQENGEITGKVGFDLSPTSVMTVSQKGKFGPDMVTKLTQSVRKLYVQENGTNPESFGDLVTFAQNHPLRLFVAIRAAGEYKGHAYDAANKVYGISKAS